MMEFTVSVSGQRGEMSGGGWLRGVGGLLRWTVLMVKGSCLYMCARSLKKMKGWSVQRPGVEDDTESFRG